ncbi:hypothetical protein MTO96_036270 [Rhipicephalus appendiculatus]
MPSAAFEQSPACECGPPDACGITPKVSRQSEVDSHRFNPEDENVIHLYCMSLKEHFVSLASTKPAGVRVQAEEPLRQSAIYLSKQWVLHAALCDIQSACLKCVSKGSSVTYMFDPCVCGVGLLRAYPLQIMTQYKTKYFQFPTRHYHEDKAMCDTLAAAMKEAAEQLQQPVYHAFHDAGIRMQLIEVLYPYHFNYYIDYAKKGVELPQDLINRTTRNYQHWDQATTATPKQTVVKSLNSWPKAA